MIPNGNTSGDTMPRVERLCRELRALHTNEDTVALIGKELSQADQEPIPWLHAAALLRRDGEFDAALHVYDVATEQFPDSPELWNNRGLLLLDYGHLDKSIVSFNRALLLRPDYVMAVENLAHAYEKLQNYDAASKLYREAISLNEHRPLSWNNLGNCLRFLGLPVDAGQCYERAIACQCTFSDALFNLATLHYEQRDYAAALDVIDRYVELVPSDLGAKTLREKICARDPSLGPIKPAPLHGAPLALKLVMNVDERGNVIEPDLDDDRLFLTGNDILGMSREEAARKVGTETWDRLHLQQLIETEISGKEPPPKYPTLPFISYRWGDTAHSAWVLQFVRDLEERGYDVVFDKQAENESRVPTPPEFVARMTDCNLFVPILTEAYTRRVLVSPHSLSPVDYGWVYEEWNVALELGRMRRIEFLGIWASGDDLPPPFTRDNVCDFRTADRYAQEMDKNFPVRYVTLFGVRPDKTFRLLTRLRRSESAAEVARLQTLSEFAWIAIVHR